MSHSMKLFGPVLAILQACLLAWMPGAVFALELKYDPPAYPSPPQRRLLADGFAAARAPTSLLIEVAKIQDGPQDALRLATRALKQSEIAYGVNDPRTIVPRINLAYANVWTGQTLGALGAFRKSIELAERVADPRDPRLFEAWYGLGAAQFAARLFDSSAESFATALQFHRSRKGLYSADQLGVLQALALAETQRGRLKQAERWQTRRVEVAERAVPEDNPDRARTYISVGRWFRDIGKSADAVKLHMRAVAIKEKVHGPDSPELIGALLDLALSVGQQQRPGFRGDSGPGSLQDSALSRAFRIADTNRQTSADERARLFHLIGDANWLVGRRGAATDAYDRAATLQLGRASADARFAAPTFLSFKAPKASAETADGGALVVAEFAVDRLGRARHIRIVESANAPNASELRTSLVRALQRAQLRPRIERGQPVKTSNVRYRLLASNDPDR